MSRLFGLTRAWKYVLVGVIGFALGSGAIVAQAAPASRLGSLFWISVLNGAPTTPCNTVGNPPTTTCTAVVDSQGNLKTVQGRAASVVLATNGTINWNSDYSSPTLDVGQFTELAFDLLLGIPASCDPGFATLVVSRKTAQGLPIELEQTQVDRLHSIVSRSYGIGGTPNVSFGNAIAVQIENNCVAGSNAQISYSLSIIGK